MPQVVHFDAAAPEYVPAAHELHVAADVLEYLPAAQLTQLVHPLSPFVLLPAGQLLHSLAPYAYLPVPHFAQFVPAVPYAQHFPETAHLLEQMHLLDEHVAALVEEQPLNLHVPPVSVAQPAEGLVFGQPLGGGGGGGRRSEPKVCTSRIKNTDNTQ